MSDLPPFFPRQGKHATDINVICGEKVFENSSLCTTKKLDLKV